MWSTTTHRAGCCLTALVLTVLGGCAREHHVNPSFRITPAEAKAALDEMAADPKPLDRPLVVLGGIYDPGFAAGHVAQHMRRIADEDTTIVHISFIERGSFDACARKLIERIEREHPSANPQQTVEVDVIGFSMGGLVARYAASPEFDGANGMRLKMARLFTVSSPHRGATLADVPTFDRRVIDMRSDSEFIAALNGDEPPYKIIPYARLGDLVVGEENAAPPGRNPWWLPKSGGLSHAMAAHDTRILADIARRLRNETPFTHEPAAPLPVE